MLLKAICVDTMPLNTTDGISFPNDFALWMRMEPLLHRQPNATHRPGSSVNIDIIEKDGRNAFRLKVSIYAVQYFDATKRAQVGFFTRTKNETATYCIGANINVPIGTTSGVAFPIFVWNDGVFLDQVPKSSTTDIWSNTAVFINAAGYLQVGSEVAASPFVFSDWNFIEAVISPSDGKVQVFLNDTQVITDALPSGLESVSKLGIAVNDGNDDALTSSPPRLMYFRDLYILDNTGTDFTSRLGPIELVNLPLSTTDTAEFLPIGDVTNIEAVSKADLNTDTYNRSPAANGKHDLFTMDTSGLESGDVIYGMVLNAFAAKSVATGVRSLNLLADDGANTTTGPTGTQTQTWKGAETPLAMAKNPSGAAWDKAKVTSLKVGYEVNA